jgi:broad specificity phosphatase PhoE
VDFPTLWLARHGETDWSAAGRHTSRTDLPLTKAGEAQALALGQALQGKRFDLVESSPRERARRTAELAGLAAIVDDDLAEWDYGQLEGQTLEEIRARFPGWTIWEGPWPGGETLAEVAARADRVIERVLALPRPGKALLVAHGHVLRVLAARWLRQPPAAGKYFMLGTATLSVLSWEHDEPAVRGWNMPAFPDLSRSLAH